MLNHRVLVDRQDARSVANTATVEYLLLYLLTHAYIVGVVAVGELETFLAAMPIAAPTLVAVGAVAVLDRVGTIAMGAQDGMSM
jgi:hypothetical protein